MRDQPTPEQTPERIAEIATWLACISISHHPRGSRESNQAFRRKAVQTLRALTATLAHLTQERDEWRASASGYGSDAVEWKIRAEQAEGTLARIDAELRRHVSKDNANGIIGMIRDLAQVAVSQTGNVEMLEATLARVKAVSQQWRDFAAFDAENGNMHGAAATDTCAEQLDAALVDPPVSSSTETKT